MTSSVFPSKFLPVLNHFKISQNQLIGKGGEGYIYSFGDREVVKIYSNTSQLYLEKLKTFQERLFQANLPYKTPLIDSIGKIEGTYYTVEKLLEGQNLETLFPKLSTSQQDLVIRNYLLALKPLKNVPVSGLPFGQVLELPGSIQANSWKEFLLNKLHQKLSVSKDRASQDVVDFSLKVQTLENMFEIMLAVEPQKTFIHGDYYFTNVLVDESLEISAVLDVSDHSSVGDFRLDVANINFLPLCTDITLKHRDYVKKIVIEEYGEEILPFLDMYGFYYAFYFSNLFTTDMTSYKWCLSILNDEKRWKKYS